MRPVQVLGAAFAGLLVLSAPVSAQRDDSFKWYIGGQGGMLGFETPIQTRSWSPSVGGHLLIVAKRSGLILSVDEALGKSETSGFGQSVANNGVREVSFDRIRKYTAVLTAFPVPGNTQPYVGLGFGLVQVIDPQPLGFFTSPQHAAVTKADADERSTSGFLAAVLGIQTRVDRLVVFGQYQLHSAPAAGKLLRGSGHSVTGGIRVSLGSAKEGIKGGGY